MRKCSDPINVPNAPRVKALYSDNGTTWGAITANTVYVKFSYDGGATYSTAIQIRGDDGTGGAGGGSSVKSFVYVAGGYTTGSTGAWTSYTMTNPTVVTTGASADVIVGSEIEITSYIYQSKYSGAASSIKQYRHVIDVGGLGSTIAPLNTVTYDSYVAGIIKLISTVKVTSIVAATALYEGNAHIYNVGGGLISFINSGVQAEGAVLSNNSIIKTQTYQTSANSPGALIYTQVKIYR